MTRWERQRAVSDRLRAAWDAQRDGREWADVFADAKERVLDSMAVDIALVRTMTWDDFKRLQGLPSQANPAGGDGARKGYAATEDAVRNSASETLWCSPHCVAEVNTTADLFADIA